MLEDDTKGVAVCFSKLLNFHNVSAISSRLDYSEL